MFENDKTQIYFTVEAKLENNYLIQQVLLEITCETKSFTIIKDIRKNFTGRNCPQDSNVRGNKS